jgi:hypothetical protein
MSAALAGAFGSSAGAAPPLLSPDAGLYPKGSLSWIGLLFAYAYAYT